MAVPRRIQIDLRNPGWVHCVSRCVRRAFLAGDGFEHRRGWIERRIQFLHGAFACETAAYAVMSNHLHLVVRMAPDQIDAWSDREVAIRWLRAFPGHRDGEDLADARAVALDEAQIAQRLQDPAWLAERRVRLSSLSWFMRSLCEPIARRANEEDDCSGRFWEGRFSSTPLLDQAALVSCMVYVDLNPIRAEVAQSVDSSAHTSAQVRWQEASTVLLAQGVAAPARRGSSPSQAAADPVDAILHSRHRTPECSWLVPIRRLTAHDRDSGAGSWSAIDYLRLVESTGRQVRADKRGAVAADLPDLVARLEPSWSLSHWMLTMCGWRQMSGGMLGDRARMQQEASRRGHGRARSPCALFQARPSGAA